MFIKKNNLNYSKIENFLIEPNFYIEEFNIKKLYNYLNNISIEANINIDIDMIIDKVITKLYDYIDSNLIINELASTCVNLISLNPSYTYIASRILIKYLHKNTINNFTDKMILLGKHNIINNDLLLWIIKNKDFLNNIINYDKDYERDFFGFKTLEKAYLLKINNIIIERPQDMILRTAITLNRDNYDMIILTYNSMSLGYYTHASPTLFNAGTNHMQLSSCFVKNTEILTMNGIKRICNINIGDMIITHKGNIKKVLQLHKNLLGNRKIKELKVFDTKEIYVTEDHEFWSISSNNYIPQWRKINELNNTHKIAMPKYNGTLKNYIININDYTLKSNIIIINNLTIPLSINLNTAFIFGIYLAFGTIKLDNTGIILSFDMNHKYYINNIIKKIHNIFNNLNLKINTINNIIDNKIIITIDNHFLGPFFSYLFGSFTKKIWNEIYYWDISLVKSLIKGYNYFEFKYNYLTNEIYHLTKLYGIINYKYCYLNCFNNNYKTINGVTFLKVKSILDTSMVHEYVYTLGIEDDHSYYVEGLICKNCFLMGTNDDLNDISTTWQSCALISKWAGGIGLHVSNIRSKNSIIKGTNGNSNGLVPFLKVFNEIARWIDQGGKRPGSIAIYIEPYHPDIFDFLELKKNFGSETERARDLFLALWIPDLFMKQVKCDGDWYLLNPNNCPNLNEVYGDEFEELYWKYVNENKYNTKINARILWMAILDSQIETGMPYICYKDSINKKNNQKNLGTIKSSNLCAEIVQYSDHNEYAVCNLASIALKSYIIPFDNKYNNWEIYTLPHCKYCNYAKNHLNKLKINYNEINFSEENNNKLKTIFNKDIITYPQIFIDSNHIGGWTELYNFISCTFDYNKLYDIAYLATINLNKIIDINYYPVPQTKISNFKHRPIGLGIQGLADVLVSLKIPFDSNDALKLNSKIMETIYLAALTASNDIAIDRYNKIKLLNNNKYYDPNFIINDIKYSEYYDPNFIINDLNLNNIYHELKPLRIEIEKCIGSYSTFDGSLFSEGKLQFDMWDNVFLEYPDKWIKLKESIKKYGTRNSLLTALMPTASTSQILGNNECFEFFTNNIYSRKTQAGDFIIINKYLVEDLLNIGLWNNELKNKIIAHNGSIQNINEIPPIIKNLYKTIWEIGQKWVVKQSLARAPFVDQTQSLNIFMAEPNYQRLTSCHFFGWENGIKTGMYYLRSKPSTDATKFTIDPNLIKDINNECLNCSA